MSHSRGFRAYCSTIPEGDEHVVGSITASMNQPLTAGQARPSGPPEGAQVPGLFTTKQVAQIAHIVAIATRQQPQPQPPPPLPREVPKEPRRSIKTAQKLGAKPYDGSGDPNTHPLGGRMRVSLPADLLVSDIVVRDSRVLIRGQEFPTDLVALDMRDFDVVLGMDWLSRHRAILDCYKKEVKLHRLGKLEVKFRGIRKEVFSSMISVGPKDMYKFMTLLPRDYCLIPGNGAIKLVGPKDMYKFMTLLPRDYCLIPGNGAIKLVDHIYEWIWIKTPIQIYDSLPKDYYLVPSNKTIKLECVFP